MSLAQLAVLAASCCYCLPWAARLPVALAETHATIPRSRNRYTQYAAVESSSSGGDEGAAAEHNPPWNPSPKINPATGFLADLFPRCPGDWEALANIRGRHGPRNPGRHARLLAVPARVRQVPGDGNCLFHSIAACLHHVVNGTHLPMESPAAFRDLRHRSRRLRHAAVDALENAPNGGRRRLFLQGGDCLEARDLLEAAAAQFDLAGEDYCALMRQDSYWGGGPEIVALCNHLQRPIHVYELIPSEEASTLSPTPKERNPEPSPSSRRNNKSNTMSNLQTSKQFTLRRMACFGSPKFDRREPLHILSADSRFPDIEPQRVRKVGNHFLAMFPVTSDAEGVDAGGGEGSARFRRHAVLRGGSRLGEGGDGARRGEDAGKGRGRAGHDGGRQRGSGNSESGLRKISRKWDGGQGSWSALNGMNWF